MIDERTVDLWRYLPEYLKPYVELDKLFEAETPEFQALVHNLLTLLDNLFIETAGNEGLKRYESILHLYPNPTDTIEVRRSNVMANWFSNKIYTLKTLLSRLQILQQNDNVQLYWDEDDAFFLHVVTRMEQSGQVDRLYEILESMLPAEIAYESINRIEFNETFNVFYGIGLVGAGTFFLTDDFRQTFNNPVPAYVGAGMSATGTLFGTNDFNETVETDMKLYYASGIVGTGVFFLTDNFNESVEISGNTFVGMANGYTEFISTY